VTLLPDSGYARDGCPADRIVHGCGGPACIGRAYGDQLTIARTEDRPAEFGVYLFTPKQVKDVQRRGERTFDEWSGPRVASTGNYTNTVDSHIAGATGEFAAHLWLNDHHIPHVRDTSRGSRWDWLTPGIAVEVKSSSVYAVERWPWNVNTATVARLARRLAQRPRSIVLWVMYLGKAAEPIGARVMGWADAAVVAASPVQTTSSRASRHVTNHQTAEHLIHPPTESPAR
jgi:hypothetical protein